MRFFVETVNNSSVHNGRNFTLDISGFTCALKSLHDHQVTKCYLQPLGIKYLFSIKRVNLHHCTQVEKSSMLLESLHTEGVQGVGDPSIFGVKFQVKCSTCISIK